MEEASWCVACYFAILYIFIYISSYSWDGRAASTSVEAQHVNRMCVNSDNMQDLAFLSETTNTTQLPTGSNENAHAPRTPPSNQGMPILSWIASEVAR